MYIGGNKKVIKQFTEANPDKGTKTKIAVLSEPVYFDWFTEANPDKGTKTGIKSTNTSNVIFMILVYRS